MNSVREKGYAKVNLFLDVLQKNGEFHDIDTVVATVSLYDSVTISKRRDDKIVLRTGGGLYRVPDREENDNAFKAASLFQKTFNTKGVDITVTKKIPVGGGLGGSSADIAATLKGMKKLFGIDCDLKPLADSLGSDASFMMEGGFARLTGRGVDAEYFNADNLKLYLLIATPKFSVSAKNCYAEYDNEPSEKSTTDGGKVVENLINGAVLKSDFYNALYPAAVRINPEIERVYGLIAALSPVATVMSGSGSSIFGVFESKELCDWAKDKLKRENLILNVVETLSKKELEKTSFFRNPFSVS